jgi:HEAT repeat protein
MLLVTGRAVTRSGRQTTAVAGAAAGLIAVLMAVRAGEPSRSPSAEGGTSVAPSTLSQVQAASSDPALDDWPEIIQSLDLSGPEGAQLVPALARLAADPAAPWVTRRQAVFTLGRIGEPARPAVPTLRELLRSNAPGEGGDTLDTPRLWSLKALALLGPAAREAAPDVIVVLEDPASPHLHRLAALEALARIGPAHPATLPQLVNVLQTPAPPGVAPDPEGAQVLLETQVAAAELLALYRGSASSAAPALLDAARNRHEPLRRAAVTTLGAIGSDLALEGLSEALLFDDSPAVQDAAAVALSKLGRSAVPRLVSLLEDRDAGVRWRAADALGRMGPLAAIDARGPLEQRLNDPDTVVRLSAAEALWTLTSEAGSVLDVALSLLSASDRQLRIRAYRLVLKIGAGPARTTVIEKLSELADGREPLARQAAVLALRELQAGAM